MNSLRKDIQGSIWLRSRQIPAMLTNVTAIGVQVISESAIRTIAGTRAAASVIGGNGIAIVRTRRGGRWSTNLPPRAFNETLEDTGDYRETQM